MTTSDQPHVHRYITLHTDVDNDQPTVDVDPRPHQQVLDNLLDNARRHTPPGGHVTIVAEHRDQNIAIEATDTGEGIPSDHLPHIFERFYRADRSRRSTPRNTNRPVSGAIMRRSLWTAAVTVT